MWWLVLPAFAVPLCVDPVPERPRPATRAEFDPDAPPRVLVPMGWHATGEVRPGGWYHDDQGRRFRYRDVEAALLDNPHSEPSYVAYRRVLEPEVSLLDGRLGDAARMGLLPDRMVEGLIDADLLSTFERLEHHHLLRAVCVFNATQGPLLLREAARELLMADIARIRTAGDPSMAVWAVASHLYEAMDAEHPADAVDWRADVAAVSEALDTGLEVEALTAQVRSREGSLAQRVQVSDDE